VVCGAGLAVSAGLVLVVAEPVAVTGQALAGETTELKIEFQKKYCNLFPCLSFTTLKKRIFVYINYIFSNVGQKTKVKDLKYGQKFLLVVNVDERKKNKQKCKSTKKCKLYLLIIMDNTVFSLA
jgi:hypothetical protein